MVMPSTHDILRPHGLYSIICRMILQVPKLESEELSVTISSKIDAHLINIDKGSRLVRILDTKMKRPSACLASHLLLHPQPISLFFELPTPCLSPTMRSESYELTFRITTLTICRFVEVSQITLTNSSLQQKFLPNGGDYRVVIKHQHDTEETVSGSGSSVNNGSIDITCKV